MNKVVEKIEIDAAQRAPGRVATEVATILLGKHRPDFAKNVVVSVNVKVVNTDQMKFTGKKLDQKEYIHHTGYPGGIRRKKMADVMEQNSAEVLRKAVWNMLPKNKLRNERMKNLTVVQK